MHGAGAGKTQNSGARGGGFGAAATILLRTRPATCFHLCPIFLAAIPRTLGAEKALQTELLKKVGKPRPRLAPRQLAARMPTIADKARAPNATPNKRAHKLYDCVRRWRMRRWRVRSQGWMRHPLLVHKSPQGCRRGRYARHGINAAGRSFVSRGAVQMCTFARRYLVCHCCSFDSFQCALRHAGRVWLALQQPCRHQAEKVGIAFDPARRKSA